MDLENLAQMFERLLGSRHRLVVLQVVLALDEPAPAAAFDLHEIGLFQALDEIGEAACPVSGLVEGRVKLQHG